MVMMRSGDGNNSLNILRAKTLLACNLPTVSLKSSRQIYTKFQVLSLLLQKIMVEIRGIVEIKLHPRKLHLITGQIKIIEIVCGRELFETP